MSVCLISNPYFSPGRTTPLWGEENVRTDRAVTIYELRECKMNYRNSWNLRVIPLAFQPYACYASDTLCPDEQIGYQIHPLRRSY